MASKTSLVKSFIAISVAICNVSQSKLHQMSRPIRRTLVLDFDGVVCASSKESSTSAILAVKEFWPHLNDGLINESSLGVEIMSLRPIIETGFENMLVCRLLIENYQRQGRYNTNEIFAS